MSSLLYSSDIDKCMFYMYGTNDIDKRTDIIVTDKSTFYENIPVPSGTYDLRMGTTSLQYTCASCGKERGKCPGHFGKYYLRYPLKNVIFIEELLKWLKIVCHKCGSLIYTKDMPSNIPKSKLIGLYVTKSNITKDAKDKKPKFKVCKICGEFQKKVKHSENNKCKIIIEDNTGKKRTLHNYEIRNILQMITKETVEKVGKKIISHPEKLIVDKILIAPVTIRPDIKKSDVKKKMGNDLQTLIKNIIELDKTIPENLDEKSLITDELSIKFETIEIHYLTMIIGSGESSPSHLSIKTNTNKDIKGFSKTISSKTGTIRSNLMGKRLEYMMRSVITGDPYMNIDEVGVPLQIAKSMQIPETVRSYNIDRLNKYYNNGPKLYPGCKRIIKRSEGYSTFLADIAKARGYKLKDGDIVYRDIVDGDLLAFGRQPSILISNIAVYKIRVLSDVSTLTMNVSACVLHNADFDGDTMIGIIATSEQAINELDKISYMGNLFMDYRNPVPMLGMHQDGVINLFELTKNSVKLDKWHFMCSLSGVFSKYIKNLNLEDKIYSGKDIVNVLLPNDLNILKKKANIFNESFAGVLKYDINDVYVNIKNGKLESGVLDGSTIKQGKVKNIYHYINRKYGAKETIDIMFCSELIGTNFMYYKGFSVGMEDIILPQKTTNEIKRRTREILENANNITRKLDEGKLIPPIYMSYNDYYEREQQIALQFSDDFVEPVLESIDLEKNAIAKLVLTGTRGSAEHMISINCALGSRTIKGIRFPQNLTLGRSSPYFRRFDMDPHSRGYISNSYIEGVSPNVFVYSASEARVAMATNGVSTRVSGKQNRIAIKNLESIYIDNLYRAVKFGSIIQQLYGETGFDVRTFIDNTYDPAIISDEKMVQNYKTDITMLPKKDQNSTITKILNDEFEIIMKDREVFRDKYLYIEYNSTNGYIYSPDVKLPILLESIINDIIYGYIKHSETYIKNYYLDIQKAINDVNTFINNLHYIFTNNKRKQMKAKMSRTYIISMTLLGIVIRSYLCTKKLLTIKIDNMLLNKILIEIEIQLKKSLVACGTSIGIISAQCGSEPLTQYVLDSKHRSGLSGSGTKTDVIKRIIEITNAKDTDKMKNPSMFIRVIEEIENDELKVKEIANEIEMIKFGIFVVERQIFYENIGKSIHPRFEHENEIVNNYLKFNPNISVPRDLTKWCFRFKLKRDALILKNINITDIVNKLEEKYENLFIIYTPFNDENLIIRCYIRHDFFRKSDELSKLYFVNKLQALEKTVIRGINGIKSASVINIVKSKRIEDGSIQSDKKIFAIETWGSNLEEILEHPYVDARYTQTDSVIEMMSIYGIDCARNKIVNEIKSTITSMERNHIYLWADEMTHIGIVTPMLKNGLSSREHNNFLLDMALENPIRTLRETALNSVTSKIYGVSAPLMIGKAPEYGTRYNKIVVNENFIKYETDNDKISNYL